MPAATFTADAITTSGASFAQLQAGGVPAIIDLLIAANAALANPTTQATVSVTAGAASSLTAGVYYASYAWVGRGGETTVGTSESASFTVGADPNDKPRISIPALPTGASSANIYLTAVGGAAGSEKLYATSVTTTTYNMTSAAWANALKAIPSSNTTGLASRASKINVERFIQANPGIFERLTSIVNRFTSGNPMTLADVMAQIQEETTAIRALSKVADDIAALIYANPGTLTSAQVAGLRHEAKRVWS